MQIFNKLYIFNPTCEMAIANGAYSWQPPAHMVRFEHDLEFLPMIFASKQDVIITQNKPSEAFLNAVCWLEGSKCVCGTLNELEALAKKGSLQIGRLEPWGWSPVMHYWFKLLMNVTSDGFKCSPIFNWQSEHKAHYSRKNALEILKHVLKLDGGSNALLPQIHIPRVITKLEEAEQLISKWNQLVMKAPWSSSGRGVQILRYKYLNTSNKQWIASVLKQQGYIMAEPLFNKKLDFSLHFHVSPKGVKYIGYSAFHTNSNGRYIANEINSDTTQVDRIMPVSSLASLLIEAIQTSDAQIHYEGYVGVDLMIVEIEGREYIHPCLEINWRYNMGLVALRINELLSDDVKGIFSVHVSPKGSFGDFCKKMTIQFSPVYSAGLPVRGFFPLSDPVVARSGAYLLLGD